MESVQIPQQEVLVVESLGNLERVVVSEHETIVVGSPSGQPSVVVTGQVGPRGASSLSQLDDLDVSNMVDGATLVYKASTNNWTATNLLNNQIIECGQF